MAIEISARRGIRTPDLLITKQLLYQLSYTGKKGGRNTASIRMLRPVQNVNAYRFQSEGTRTVCYLSGLTYLCRYRTD